MIAVLLVPAALADSAPKLDNDLFAYTKKALTARNALPMIGIATFATETPHVAYTARARSRQRPGKSASTGRRPAAIERSLQDVG